MLAKAIQEHVPAPGPKNTTLSQHYKNNANSLRPSPPSTLNAPRPNSTNPLKRTASQANGIESSCSSSQNGLQDRNIVDTAQLRADGGRVGQLHVNVYFDENDFEDDNNIDLDAEDLLMASTKQSSVSSSATRLPPRNPKTFVTPKPSISSTPIPWSSSPPEHHQMPSPKPPLKVGTGNATNRRNLPWLDKSLQSIDSPQEEPNISTAHEPPAHIRDLLSRKKEKTRDSKVLTPLSRDNPKSPYLWNKTASAVKEEQRRIRQGSKHSIKNNKSSTEKSNAGRKRETVARVFLSDEQKSVLDLVAEKKKSIFFTGSAGTGKSVLLREIIKALRDRHKREPDRVAITASTGLAACNVGGVTLHSFAGIGLGKEPVPELVKKIKRNQKAKARWMRTKILIIDEISMVDGDLFDKLEAIARAIRNNGRPFGGIQLVITGDFFQLPPVPDYGRISKFSFDATTWNTSIEHTIGLTQVFRQKDPGKTGFESFGIRLIVTVFANMLNEMRLGRLTPKSVDAFRALNRPLDFKDDFEATELYATSFL